MSWDPKQHLALFCFVIMNVLNAIIHYIVIDIINCKKDIF